MEQRHGERTTDRARRGLRKVRKAQEDLPSDEALVRERTLQAARLAEADQEELLARGRGLVGRAIKGSLEDASKRVAKERACLQDLDDQIAGAAAKRAALAELIPSELEAAQTVVGQRLLAAAAKVAQELLEIAELLEARQHEADLLADHIDQQFFEVLVDGRSRPVGPFRHRGPWLGVLRCFGRYGSEKPRTTADRLRRFRTLLKDCKVA